MLLLLLAGDGLGKLGFAFGLCSIGAANYDDYAVDYMVCISVFFEAPPPIFYNLS